MLSRARALWRDAREAPLLGSLLAYADRMWWAHTIRRAAIVDPDVVAAQLGRSVSIRSAVRRYVRGGFRTGFTLNPLLMERTVSRQLSDSDRVPALYAYLVNDRARLQVSPSWDAPGLAVREPASLQDPAGPLGFVWRRARREGWVELGGSTEVRRVEWTEVLRAVNAPPVVSRPVPVRGRLVVCVLGLEEIDADEALVLARDAPVGVNAEVDLVLTGTSFEERAQAALLGLREPRITVRHARLADATEPPGDVRPDLTVFRGPDAALSSSSMHQLAAAAERGPVAALWLAPDGTVTSAGTVIHDGEAIALLAGHPIEDARRIGPTIEVPILAGPARAWPAGTVPSGPGRTLTGATTASPGSPAHVSGGAAGDTDLDAILAPAGLFVAQWPDGQPILQRADPSVAGARRSLRWAIKTAAPAGPRGESWGDTHFARGLAEALERIGQSAAVDAYPARDRPTNYLDDVTLVLRGPRRIVPPKTGRRILWIISHPDEITAAEVADFDVVFAASEPWARSATARLGGAVHALLQCTDTTRFHPSGAAPTGDIVFVGTARGIARPVVVEPLRAGVPVRVYGPDWTGYIPGSAIAGTSVANARLPELYERAAVVLNDHWPAMRREGFVSNRLFDVIAAGGRAISDDVEGIEDLFEGAVAVYRSIPDLINMLEGDVAGLFPGRDRLADISARVRAMHSFDARALALFTAATAR